MKKKILIAEDDPSLREIYQLLLSRKGYEVEMMFNENLMGDWSGEKADLFLLDLHLSGHSGLEICRRLLEAISAQLGKIHHYE